MNPPIFRSTRGTAVPTSLDDFYDSMINTRGRELASAVAVLADASPPVLTHTTGNDHTGLVVALALLAAGIPEDEVLTDYVFSPPTELRAALGGLSRFGGAQPYLLRHGLTVEQLHSLRDQVSGSFEGV